MTSYDETARNYNELHGEEQKRKARIVVDYLKKHSLIADFSQVLDVGCGTCVSTALFPGQKTGIDPSKELLKQCKIQMNLVHGNAEDLPFPDKWFEVVLSLTAVHNFTDVQKGLKEMKRVGSKVWVVTVLKKSPQFAKIESAIRKLFKVEIVLDDSTDSIFVLR